MTQIKLPYIHRFVDRHGRTRHYFRRGGKRVPLPGLVGSAEFMDAYQIALASGDEQPREIGATRSKPGTVAAAVAGYFSSLDFTHLAENTKKGRRNILDRFRQEHGDKRIGLLQRVHIETMIAAKQTPATALHFWIALRELMKFAIRTGLRNDDPTQYIKRPRIKSDGFYTWSDDDIAKFAAAHPVGTRARLAMALGLYLGQRRSDIIGLGWQHIQTTQDGPVITVRQQKTGATLSIPIHPELQTVLDATPRDQMTFLVTQYGRPFTPIPFTIWFKKCCLKAGLPKNATFHGLRKAAARLMAEGFASDLVISAVTGHKSRKEVARYTAAADQLRLARQGIKTIPGTKKWQT